jgi:hypothetical protein
MEENEVQALENEQEVISQDELSDVATDDSVTLSKSEYAKMKRQSLAYQASKGAEVKPRAETPAPTGSDDKLKELELKIDGYSKDEIELIKEFGFDKASNPIVQKAIDVMRQERKSKEADVQVSNKSAIYKKYTNDDLKNMSVEELRKILPHADN